MTPARFCSGGPKTPKDKWGLISIRHRPARLPAHAFSRVSHLHGHGRPFGHQRATRSVVSAAETRTEYFCRAVLTKATPNNPTDSPSISSPVRNAGL